jgi:hypothetical protein
MKPEPMKKVFLLFVFCFYSFAVFSQASQNKEVIRNFSGSASVTNKGISIIPLFTLGKPAMAFEMAMGNRLSFEPQFRFALNGKPWSFLFWWRYELLNTEHFTLRVGAHPSVAFKEATDTTGGIHENYMKADRYLAGEIAPAWSLTENIRLGFYYLLGHGLEKHQTQYTHYLAFTMNFSNIGITEKVYLRFSPQTYYLKLDKDNGFYASGVLTLAMRDFPLSVSSMVNKTIRTDITGSPDFNWNVSLVYSFAYSYTRQ